MKSKKYNYLIVLIVMLLIGINGVEAKVTKTCYYIEETKQSLVKLNIKDGSWNISTTVQPSKAYSEVFVNKLGSKIDNDSEPILNWYGKEKDSVTGMTLNAINSGKSAAKKSKTCPEYLMARTNNKYSSYGVFATNSKSIAQSFVDKSNAAGGYKTWLLTYKDSSGNEFTSEDYYETFVTMNPEDIYDMDATITCTELFGDKSDDGEANDVGNDGIASIAYMVDSVLQYVRVIVPILIIILGVLDLAKAVIAAKEDDMRKAQTTFIKRLFLGLLVFFVPLIVDVLMNLADIVWEAAGYSSCEFK